MDVSHHQGGKLGQKPWLRHGKHSSEGAIRGVDAIEARLGLLLENAVKRELRLIRPEGDSGAVPGYFVEIFPIW
jgi:hypothetical protein